jgi:hypothetical protein
VWRKDDNGTKVDVTLKAIGSPTPGGDTDEDYECSRAKLLQEVVIMRQFRHPNIPRLHGVIEEGRVSRQNETIKIGTHSKTS